MRAGVCVCVCVRVLARRGSVSFDWGLPPLPLSTLTYTHS